MNLLDRLAALDRRLGLDPGARGRRSKRMTAWVAAVLSLIMAVPLGAALWNGQHDRDVAARLRRSGVVADAQVVDLRDKGRLAAVAGEEVSVTFRTERGDDVSTWITVSDLPPRGPATIRYLASDPSVARLVDDPVPRGGIWPVVVALFFLLGWIAAAARGIERRR